MTVDELIFADEIDCQDLFPGNDPREKIVVFEMGELQVRENETRNNCLLDIVYGT